MFFTIPLVRIDEETTLSIFDILVNKSVPLFYIFYVLVGLPIVASIINSFETKKVGLVINILLSILSISMLITLVILTSEAFSILYWFIIYLIVLLGNLTLLIFSYLKNNNKNTVQDNL